MDWLFLSALWSTGRSLFTSWGLGNLSGGGGGEGKGAVGGVMNPKWGGGSKFHLWIHRGGGYLPPALIEKPIFIQNSIYWNDLKMHRILFVLFSQNIYFMIICILFLPVFALNQYQWFGWKSKSALAFRERGVTLHYQIRWFCMHKRIGFPGCISGKVH